MFPLYTVSPASRKRLASAWACRLRTQTNPTQRARLCDTLCSPWTPHLCPPPPLDFSLPSFTLLFILLSQDTRFFIAPRLRFEELAYKHNLWYNMNVFISPNAAPPTPPSHAAASDTCIYLNMVKKKKGGGRWMKEFAVLWYKTEKNSVPFFTSVQNQTWVLEGLRNFSLIWVLELWTARRCLDNYSESNGSRRC